MYICIVDKHPSDRPGCLSGYRPQEAVVSLTHDQRREFRRTSILCARLYLHVRSFPSGEGAKVYSRELEQTRASFDLPQG